MKYLFDVNALVALGFLEHEFHPRVARWVSTSTPSIATCSITELGFVRVLAQAFDHEVTVPEARNLLKRLKAVDTLQFTFLSDAQDVTHLPAWVKTARQLTDGHLLQLAKAHSMALATLDRKIPGAYIIPGL
jgi:predicted nucleic acid-binding protein